MALFDRNDEERTETATSYRREEFRREGNVAVSREVLSIVMLLSIGFAVYFSAGNMMREFQILCERVMLFAKPAEFGKQQMLDLRMDVFKSLAWMVSPILLIAIVAGLVGSVSQVGFYFTTEPLTPKWERINPTQGLDRILSKNGGIEAVKAFVKLVIAGVVVYHAMKTLVPNSVNFLGKNIHESAVLTLAGVWKVFIWILLSLVAVAALDYLYQRFELEKKMRMTRREAKEEFKLREGDPLIKQRIKSIQKKIASRRMMEAVPKAAVVVTNPTHLAIALQYDAAQMAAPRVLAKGAGVIAEKIKEIARFHRIPIVENKPLARTIFKTLDVNEYIPKELYKAVAQVLSYVYRLKGSRPAQQA